MKRHEALHSLSHDHQNVLARALRLRRAGDADAATRCAERNSFIEFARERVAPHFVAEEELLDRVIAEQPDGPLRAGRDRMLAEHAALRSAVERLADAGPEPAGSLLVEVGELTTAHVRFEERELFELLQQELGDRLTGLVDA